MVNRKVLCVMRSSHLHTQLVEVNAKVNVIGDISNPTVEADLEEIEADARCVMRFEGPFGPWNEKEADFDLDFVLCAPLDHAMHRGRIAMVKPVEKQETLAWKSRKAG